MKIEHIGIAVKSLGDSDNLFAKLMGKSSYKHETVEREGVETSFYEIGDSKIELLEISATQGIATQKTLLQSLKNKRQQQGFLSPARNNIQLLTSSSGLSFFASLSDFRYRPSTRSLAQGVFLKNVRLDFARPV